MDQLDFRPLGDGAIRIGFGDEVSREIHMKIRDFCFQLERAKLPMIKEWVPSYTAVTIFYERNNWSYEEVLIRVQAITMMQEGGGVFPEPRLIRIPVCYGGEWGPDLLDVARIHDVSVEEVIRLHTAKTYLVHMIGFAPGFPYLGGLDPMLTTPRRKNPRHFVPAGSVGIAGEQTGIYPLSTPGGWQLIGQTPLQLYDPKAKKPTLLLAGDELIFYEITTDEFRERM